MPCGETFIPAQFKSSSQKCAKRQEIKGLYCLARSRRPGFYSMWLDVSEMLLFSRSERENVSGFPLVFISVNVLIVLKKKEERLPVAGQWPPSRMMSSMAVSLLTEEPLMASNTIWKPTRREEAGECVSDSKSNSCSGDHVDAHFELCDKSDVLICSYLGEKRLAEGVWQVSFFIET